MMKAIVNTAICPLYAGPGQETGIVDEALYGMVVDILEEPAPGWYRVRTPYRYEGTASAAHLLVGDEGRRLGPPCPSRWCETKTSATCSPSPRSRAGT